MGSVQYEGDVFNYQGAEYDKIGIDEAGQFTQFMFDNFRTNLRNVRPDINLQMYLGSNPGGVGHGWLKRLFLDKEFEKGEDPAEYRYIPAKVYDNFALMKNTPEYVKELETLPPDLRRAYLEGDWDVFSGQVFSEWRRDKHVVPNYPFPIEDSERVISFDWGYNDHGAAVFLAKGKDGRILMYREIYQNRKTPDEWAEELALAAQVLSISFINLPHDCFSRQQGHDSIAEVFKRTFQKMGVNIPIRRADSLSKGARANGLALFHTWLSDAPDGDPYFQVHQSCNNTIRTLPELVYKQSGDNTSSSEDVDCFVAGTKISTPNGDRNVEDLKVGDLVETPIGARKVLKAGVSGKSEKVVSVYLSNGKQLRGTSNHKVYVHNKGLVELQYLCKQDILGERITTTLWKSQLKLLFTTILPTTKERDGWTTSLTARTLKRATLLSIDKFILTILEKFLKATTFTIKTIITTITIPLTWSPLLVWSTPYTTTKLTYPTLKRKEEFISGTILRQEKNSYEKTHKKCETIVQPENLGAKIVGLLLKQDTKESSIATIVKTLKAYIKPFVPFVVKSFFRNLMGNVLPKPVHIVAVGNLEEEQVYRLTVEEAHLYYANNILTTNTDGEDHLYDAIRIAFITFGRPKGHGGGVKMKGTERDKVYNPTISPDNTVPGIDPKDFLKKNNKRGWKYL